MGGVLQTLRVNNRFQVEERRLEERVDDNKVEIPGVGHFVARIGHALLDRLVAAAADERENILPVTIDLVAAGATMGDIVERLKGLWGPYRERPVF